MKDSTRVYSATQRFETRDLRLETSVTRPPVGDFEIRDHRDLDNEISHTITKRNLRSSLPLEIQDLRLKIWTAFQPRDLRAEIWRFAV